MSDVRAGRFEPHADATALRSYYSVIDDLLERFEPELAHLDAARSGWSVEQHVGHLALANELVLRNVQSLIAGKGALVSAGGSTHPMALQLLAAGSLPRGQAQAPRMVRPPDEIDRELVRQWLDDGRKALESLELARVAPGELKVPHQLLGALDGPQWLRFGAVHTRHHLVIALELLEPRRGTRKLPELAPLAR